MLDVVERLRTLAVQVWPVDRLLPYSRNARTHSDEQIAQVAASMREFGWTNPILVGADNIIIAGHARLAAARKLGFREVPVIVLDHLTETQRRALVLADNKLALNAGWDEEMLRVELEALTRDDMRRILTEPEASLIKQYVALMQTEGVTLDITPEAIDALADVAVAVNSSVENIGARRLQTVMERVLDEISFVAPDRNGETIRIDAAYVQKHVGDLAKNADLSRFIL